MGKALDVYYKMVEVMKAGDDEATRALIDPNFVMYEDESMPYGGIYRGPDGLMELIYKVWNTWGGSHFEPQYQLEEPGGDRVATVVHFKGHLGKSKTPVEAIINEVWTIRNGMAVEARVWYYDATRIARAIQDAR